MKWLLCLLPFLVSAGTEQELFALIKNKVDAQRATGIAMAYVDTQGTIFLNYGKADQNRAVDADTLFDIGSITKVMTAVVLMQLDGEGKLRVSDPIAKFLPEAYATKAPQQLTLHHLATHTAGLPDYPQLLNMNDFDNPFKDTTQAILFKSFSETKPPENNHWQYSSFGYALLGQVMARHLGTDYETLLQKQFFQPLGIAGASTKQVNQDRSNLATGYDYYGNPLPRWTIADLAPAGGVQASTKQLSLFLEALLEKKNTSLTKAMQRSFEKQVVIEEKAVFCGYGWNIYAMEDEILHFHNGKTSGFSAFLGINRKSQKGVVLLSNGEDSLFDIGACILNPKMPKPEEKPIPRKQKIYLEPSKLKEYEGVYELGPGFNLTVVLDETSLTVQATGQTGVRIFPVSETEFFFQKLLASISFKREDGKVSGLTFAQGARESFAKKLK